MDSSPTPVDTASPDAADPPAADLAPAAARHDAFISYSRKDAAFARALEQALEHYKPPRDLPVPQRPLDVFLDEGDFTGVDYYRAVEHHLQQSRKLIVACSPAASASRYVNDEIERFVKTHGADDLIPVLLYGLPNNEATAPGSETSRAFPPALVRALEMPLAADYRQIDLKRQRVDRGLYAGPWYSLLANLYGQSRAAIEQRALRRAARIRRITWAGALGVIGVLSVALAVSVVYRNRAEAQRVVAETQRDRAERAAEEERAAKARETDALRVQERLRGEAEASRDEAEASRDEALRQRRIAEQEAVAARRETAERLAVQAVEKLRDTPEQAIALGRTSIDAFRRKNDPLVPSAMGALHKVTLAFGGGVPVLPQADAGLQLATSPDLRWAAQTDADGNVGVAPVGGTRVRRLVPPPLDAGWAWCKASPAQLAFGPRRLAVTRCAENGEARRLVLYAVALDDGGLETLKPAAAVPGRPAGVAGRDAAAIAERAVAPGARRAAPAAGQGATMASPEGPVATLIDARGSGRWDEPRPPLVSPDGRWIAWRSNAYRHHLRAFDGTAAATQTLECDRHASHCLPMFSPDSSLFVLYSQDEGIRRYALPNVTATSPGGAPVERPAVAVQRTAPVHSALFAGWQPVPGSGTSRASVRLAVLEEAGHVRWWDLAEDEPAEHALPDLREAYAGKLRLSSLAPDLVRTRLAWNPGGSALLATIVHNDDEFGLAAVHPLAAGAPWKPLWHRYDGKAMETSSRVDSRRGGYRIEDSADLGVRDAVWISVDGALTLGFDGTVWFRDLDRIDRFQLVERDASAIHFWATFAIVGGRDGRLRFWNIDRESGKPWLTLSAHDGPVARIGVRGRPARLLATDARGIARVWELSHPALLWLDTADSESVLGRGMRWVATRPRHIKNASVGLWPMPPSRGPLAPPWRVPGTQRTGSESFVDAHGRWLVTLHDDADGAPAAASRLSLQLWPLTADAPPARPALQRRWRLPRAAPPSLDDPASAPAATTPAARWAVELGAPDDADPAALPRRALLRHDTAGLWAVDPADPATQPARIGRATERLLRVDASADLRWLLTWSTTTNRHGVADLAAPPVGPAGDPQYAVTPLPLESAEGDEAVLSDDGRWLWLRRKDGTACVARLRPPSAGCVETPAESAERKQRLDVQLPAGQAPIAWRAGHEPLALTGPASPPRFVAMPGVGRVDALTWDRRGRWLATWSKASGAVLRHYAGAAATARVAALRLPDPPPEMSAISHFFPMIERGWLLAADGDGGLLIWHRDGEGRWQPPVFLNADDTRLQQGPYRAQLSADGRQVLVDGWPLALDPDRLSAEAARLASGRVGSSGP